MESQVFKRALEADQVKSREAGSGALSSEELQEFPSWLTTSGRHKRSFLKLKHQQKKKLQQVGPVKGNKLSRSTHTAFNIHEHELFRLPT